jgi:hypothetical protein
VDEIIAEMEEKRRRFLERARELKHTIATWRRINEQRKAAAQERRAA